MHLLPPVTTCIHCFIEKSNRYPPLPHVTSLLHKKCACYHLHPLCFLEKFNCYQLLPHVASLFILLLPLVTTLKKSSCYQPSSHVSCLLHKKYSWSTNCNHCFPKKSCHCHVLALLPKVASLLHKKYSLPPYTTCIQSVSSRKLFETSRYHM